MLQALEEINPFLINKMNKKGQLGIQSLGAVAIILIVAAIIIAIGAEILDNVQTQIEGDTTGGDSLVCGLNGTAAYNATCGGLAGANTFGDWLDTIALIIVAAIVIGIIATSFGRN